MAELKVGDRVTLTLAPSIGGVVTEVLEVPGDDLYLVLLDGQTEAITYSRAVLTAA